ncbi:MAG: hypothetical protein DLM54_00590 [Acidimicrobiales bacterium]|nr:MAG: hypothetical protein DLM54_00590 [Acidimicrobiales bacterium]
MKRWEVDALLRTLVRRGTRRGLLGGNRAWLVIGGLAFVVRRLRRRDAGVVWSEEVSPGQVVSVEHLPRGDSRRRRRARSRGAATEPGGYQVAAEPPPRVPETVQRTEKLRE